MTDQVPQDISGIPTIHEALEQVRRQVGAIPKGDQAPAKAGGFSYRGIDRIRVKTALPMAGISVTETDINKDVSTYTSSGGTQMRLVEVEITYEVFGPAGDSVTTMGMGAASDTGSRANRQASIDAYKDMIETLLNIAPEVEDAEENDQPAARAASEPEFTPAPSDVLDGLYDDANAAGVSREDLWEAMHSLASAAGVPAPAGWRKVPAGLVGPVGEWIADQEQTTEDEAEVPF